MPLVPDLDTKHRPIAWRWIAAAILGTVLLVGGMTALVVILLQPGTGGQPAPTAEPARTPGRDAMVERPADQLPQKPLPVAPPKDADYVNPNPKPLPSGEGVMRLDAASEVDVLGNAHTKLTCRMPPVIHAHVRRLMTRQALVRGIRDIPMQMKNVLDFMDLDATRSILEDPQGEFGEKDFRLQFREIGNARLQSGCWTFPLSSDTRAPYELIEKKDSRFVTVRSVKHVGGVAVVMQMVITLPAGAHHIDVVAAKGSPNQLVYQLPAPADVARAATPRPSLGLEAKPHLLSALYKLYGDPRFLKMWAARSAFRNSTAEILSRYQVRFRLVGYSEWSSWNHSDIVYPGQTVVDHFRPMINVKVRDLKERVPVDIEAEYEYTRPNQEIVRDRRTQPTRLMGFNDGVYTDVVIDADSPWIAQLKGAPLLLASFTAGNDPVIQEVVGKLSKAMGGASPTDTDRAAGLFLKALYNLMRSNIAYETARGSVIDGLLHQELKYARDVLRTKSGTCINTSIFFATVAEAAGLDPYIVVIPGHAFAAVRLPKSKQFVFIETTGCGGGTLTTSYPFELVCKAGTKEFQEAARSGLFLLVHIADLRTMGVTPPEMPDAGKNALDEWKIHLPGSAADERPRDTTAVPLPNEESNAVITGVRKEPDVVKDGRKGMAFHVRLRINHARGVPCEVLVACVDKDKRLVKSRLGDYAKNGYLYHSVIVKPADDEAEWADLALFLPYDGFDVGPGTHRFVAVFTVVAGDKPLSKLSETSLVPLTLVKGRSPLSQRMLPRHFDALNLTDAQKEQVFATMDSYDRRIKQLTEKVRRLRGRPYSTSLIVACVRQIKKLQAERPRALEDILTEEQREQLRQLQD
jgi:hypothetical protein